MWIVSLVSGCGLISCASNLPTAPESYFSLFQTQLDSRKKQGKLMKWGQPIFVVSVLWQIKT